VRFIRRFFENDLLPNRSPSQSEAADVVHHRLHTDNVEAKSRRSAPGDPPSNESARDRLSPCQGVYGRLRVVRPKLEIRMFAARATRSSLDSKGCLRKEAEKKFFLFLQRCGYSQTGGSRLLPNHRDGTARFARAGAMEKKVLGGFRMKKNQKCGERWFPRIARFISKRYGRKKYLPAAYSDRGGGSKRFSSGKRFMRSE